MANLGYIVSYQCFTSLPRYSVLLLRYSVSGQYGDAVFLHQYCLGEVSKAKLKGSWPRSDCQIQTCFQNVLFPWISSTLFKTFLVFACDVLYNYYLCFINFMVFCIKWISGFKDPSNSLFEGLNNKLRIVKNLFR